MIIKEEKSDKRLNDHIYLSLKDILKSKNSVLIGEDICNLSKYTSVEYGGAFNVTKDLSDLFPDQVINSPISESAIVGFSLGVSLNGSLGITEIMFGDFITLCFDQIIQQISKIPEMYGRKLNLPLIIRTPMGGRRGYGPTHSQNLEKFFLLFLI